MTNILVFANYVNQTVSLESTLTLKDRVDVIHIYLFHYKTNDTLVAGGSCYYQNFRNKIVIPTILAAYNSNWPIIMLPGITWDAKLQLNYFAYLNPLEMEQNQVYQLALGA